MTAIAPAPIAACLAAKAESNKNSIEFKTDNSARGYYSKDYWNSSIVLDTFIKLWEKAIVWEGLDQAETLLT